jgi:hypothetical protein
LNQKPTPIPAIKRIVIPLANQFFAQYKTNNRDATIIPETIIEARRLNEQNIIPQPKSDDPKYPVNNSKYLCKYSYLGIAKFVILFREISYLLAKSGTEYLLS